MMLLYNDVRNSYQVARVEVLYRITRDERNNSFIVISVS